MRKLSTLFLGLLFAGQTFTVCASDIPNASETKQGEIWRHEETSGINELLEPENGVYGIHTYAEDQNAWDSQFYIIFADEMLNPGTPISVHFEYRKDGEGDVSFNACGFADPHVYVNNDGWGTLEATDEWQVYEDEFETSGGYGDTPGIRAFGVYVSLAPHVDGTLLFRNIIITVDGVEAVKTMETDADYAEFSEDNGDDNFSFNEWFLQGSQSYWSSYTIGNDGSAIISIPDETSDAWDIMFCNIFKNVEGQEEGNEFSLSFDIKWEGESEDESVPFYIWSGLYFYTDEEDNIHIIHDDYRYQINSEQNTEILFGENNANFSTTMYNPHMVAVGEWTHIEWGGTIGEKGADYIGVQLNLANQYGVHNVGNFRIKNMEVQFGENVLTFFEVAENSNSYTLLYETNGNEATVTGIELTENVTTVTIPSTVTIEGVEYTVTAIGNEAFRGYRNLTSVTLPNTLTTIGDWAFYYCKNLTSMTIPNSVTSVGDYTFVHCENMTSITLPNTLTRISEEMFHSCYKLASITIPETVTSIGFDAFVDCRSLTELKIPNSVTQIGAYAFYLCNNLTYNIYDSAKYLGNDVNPYLCLIDAETEDVTSCEIHPDCRFINHRAFFFHENITTVSIPESVTRVGGWAFTGCNKLVYNEYDNALYLGNSENPYLCLVKEKSLDITSCEINSNCKIICSMAFGSENLRTVTIPNSVTVIEDGGNGGGFNMGQGTLYCQADSIPAGWQKWWKTYDEVLVKWNCKVLNVGVNNAEYGAAAVTGDVVELSNGSLWSPSGAAVTLTATPKDGYHFVKWSDNNNTASRTLNVTSDSTITAIFEAHTVVTDTAVAATCTVKGKTEGSHCSVCGTIIVAQTETPMAEHTEFIDAAVAATCTESGKTEGKHCSVCNAVLVAQQEVKAHGHTEVVDTAVAATCTESGKTEGKHCSVCNAVLIAQQEISALGHTIVTDKAVPATTTSTGLTEGEHCSYCGEVLIAQIVIPMLEVELGTTVTESAVTAVNIHVHSNTIVVENATDEIFVYNAMGRLVGREVARNFSTITVKTTGVYIVKTGSTVKRVMVN